MRLQREFKIDDLPQEENRFDPIPPGWYQAVIKDVSVEQTKKGGQMVVFRYDVEGPSYEGRVVWQRLNIINDSEAAEKISRRQLGAIMRAIGLATLHPDRIHEPVGKHLEIKVDIEKSDEYGDKNRVKATRAIKGAAPPTVKPESTPKSNDGAAKPPWAR